jgi:hypothetical protein
MIETVAMVKGYLGKTEDERKIVNKLSELSNYLTSVTEAADMEDITLDDVLKFRRSMTSQIPVVINRMSKLTAKKAENIVQSNDWLSGLGKIKEAIAPDIEDAAPTIDENLLRGYATFKTKLPASSSKKEWVLLELPVIPIFDPFVTPNEVEANGFAVSAVGNYTVIERQLVCGVNVHQTKKTHHTSDEIVELVIASLSRRTNKKWEQVEGSTGVNGWMYFWLITERQRNLLNRFGSKHAGISEWGFAFK